MKFVTASNIYITYPSTKLLYQNLGPFEVKKQVEPMAYKLKILCQ